MDTSMLFLLPVTTCCLVVAERTRTVHGRVTAVYTEVYTAVYTEVYTTGRVQAVPGRQLYLEVWCYHGKLSRNSAG